MRTILILLVLFSKHAFALDFNRCVADHNNRDTTILAKNLVIQDANTGDLLEGATVKLYLKDDDDKYAIVAISDINGKVAMGQLDINQNYKADISCIGYKSKAVEISKWQAYPIGLEKDYRTLEEIIVVGYGSTRREVIIRDFSERIKKSKDRIAKNQQHILSFKFLVYPNPASRSGIITVKLLDDIKGRIEIINAGGQLIQSLNVGERKNIHADIKINSPAAGVYFVRLIDEATQKSLTEKLIVK